MLLTLSDPLLRSASFASEDRWLLWARMRMYSDHLELTGWSFFGRHYRNLPLGQVEKVDCEDGHLLLGLETGEQLSLILDHAASWANLIEAQINVRDDLRSDA